MNPFYQAGKNFVFAGIGFAAYYIISNRQPEIERISENARRQDRNEIIMYKTKKSRNHNLLTSYIVVFCLFQASATSPRREHQDEPVRPPRGHGGAKEADRRGVRQGGV